MVTQKEINAFRRIVWKHYRAQGRHALPWRENHDPYRILVSEVMLQQTQVERVIAFFTAWMKKYPMVENLAAAPLSEVLTLWQGLGYNRRAKMLHEAAKAVVKDYGGKFPASPEALEELPGIGPYTARAVAAFAHNQNVVFIETNLRTVVTHHFFGSKKNVDDTEVLAILTKALPKGRAREWYAALMDYGSYLKRTGVRINARAKGYKKQPAFQGSEREARGALLKALVRGPKEPALLIDLFGASRRDQLKSALSRMTKEGMIMLSKGKFQLPE
jgi:A/G-specific adenine glycosylase